MDESAISPSWMLKALLPLAVQMHISPYIQDQIEIGPKWLAPGPSRYKCNVLFSVDVLCIITCKYLKIEMERKTLPEHQGA